MKQFHILYNIGTVKYLVSFHDGYKKHPDASAFFDVRTFKNKKKLAAFVKELRDNGFTERA